MLTQLHVIKSLTDKSMKDIGIIVCICLYIIIVDYDQRLTVLKIHCLHNSKLYHTMITIDWYYNI